MRLSFSESIAFFLLLSPFGGISANDDEYNVHKDCSSFTWTFNTEKDTHFHMPTECPHHMVSEEEKAVCDPPDQFPMKCTFHLIDHSNEYEENDGQRRMVADMDGFNHTSLEKVVSNERDLVSKSTTKKKSTSKHGNQYVWAASCITKFAFAQDITKCTPKWRGRNVRGIECSLCWGFMPCNCNCRGWDQVVVSCWEPCWGEISQREGLYCFKPCSDTIELHTGCGLIPDERTCVKNDEQCVNKYFNHVINIVDVAAFFSTGGTVSAMKIAVRVALEDAKSSARKTALKAALRPMASDMEKKLMNNPQIKKELRGYSKGVGERILTQGAVLLLVSNLKDIADTRQDYSNLVLEVAKLVDPAGVVSLVSGFVPPKSCASVEFEPLPKPNYGLIDKDVLDVLDDNDNDLAVKLN